MGKEGYGELFEMDVMRHRGGEYPFVAIRACLYDRGADAEHIRLYLDVAEAKYLKDKRNRDGLFGSKVFGHPVAMELSVDDVRHLHTRLGEFIFEIDGGVPEAPHDDPEVLDNVIQLAREASNERP